MTVTYVDAETLERIVADLGVKELYVSLTGKQLAEKMNELQDDFGIGRKVCEIARLKHNFILFS